MRLVAGLLILDLLIAPARAQTPPSAAEIAAYQGLHLVAARGDVTAAQQALAAGAKPNATDAQQRSPLHVAAHFGHGEVARILLAAGADPRALDAQRYDILTIAAVRNDLAFVQLALQLGADARAITSPYQGTALIAAAHLGHGPVLEALIGAEAPLDHVNNLGWTALIEAIVLGDGGLNHTQCVRILLEAGANPNLPDGAGRSPLALARARGYGEMAGLIAAAGGR
ncbi:MAG TPA: ankyrin repeat domain-containing protein [Hyphomicrobiaceae bacterium]|nr:ankyrin repeat domain-containing protein [Hyphomicrobiaceae bacterium]